MNGKHEMNQELRLPRAISLTELKHDAGGSRELRSSISAGPEAGDWLDGEPDASVIRKPVLSLKNIAYPLALPKEAELISLTTYEGKLVVLTSKGPYIWQNSDWEQVVPSRSSSRTD